MKIYNPASGQVIDDVSEDAPEAIVRKVDAARRAQPAWAARPFAERAAILKRFRDLVVARKETLAQILTREVGKPITQARNELNALPGRLDFFLANTERTLAEETVHSEPGLVERVGFEPLGVVANISAWNYPWFVGSNVFFPALLTGNAVVYKPSELATLTGLAIRDLLHESGVPAEVFASAIGAASAGAALLDAHIDSVCFTGSYATGRRIAESAGKRLIRVQLELGGKDPIYVADDVDVAAAAAAVADGAFYNTGQSCCAVERIYVHEKIHDAFVQCFVAEVSRFKLGDPQDESTYIGPLTRAAQVGVLERQVQDALTKGAQLLLGGKRLDRPGNWFTPTVFDRADHTMELMREESFGPVIGIASVTDDDAALRLMNDTEYGLTAGVYSQSQERAQRILAGVHAGSAYWNCCDRVSPRLPWSGRGHSGLGSTLGTLGIRTFVQPKAWHLRG